MPQAVQLAAARTWAPRPHLPCVSATGDDGNVASLSKCEVILETFRLSHPVYISSATSGEGHTLHIAASRPLSMYRLIAQRIILMSVQTCWHCKGKIKTGKQDMRFISWPTQKIFQFKSKIESIHYQ